MRFASSMEPAAWRPAAMAFRERILGLVRGSINAKGQLTHDPSHPIFNFIFQYYFIEKRILLRWTPGPGVLVRGAAPVEPLLWQGRGWQAHADGGHYDVRQLHSGKPGRLNGLRRAREILRRTAERAAHLNCYGMHEWAMLYQPDGEGAPPRHQQLPLRLEQAALNRVVAETPIACTHFDAYRFFAPSAVALNTARPTRQQQAEHEQPGCVHASMDLFKYAAKLHPHLPSSLLADTLELAIAARVLDMRASPYDLRAVDTPGFDLRAVRVETAEGRREYQLEQAAVARRAAPLRRQLLHHYDAALDAVAKPAEPAAVHRREGDYS